MLRRRRGSLISPPDLRIVLVGKTGSGKSSTGNTILKRNIFKSDFSLKSVTMSCQKNNVSEGGRNISVIDTPGLFDTSMTNENLESEIQKCVEMSVPGPHVFLLVIRLDVRFTEEEKNAVKWIQKNFGGDAIKHTIILFTHADALKGKSLHKHVEESEDMQAVISQCGGRYHSFNNEKLENRDQVTQLLNMIDKMVKDHDGQFYTNTMYEKAQKKIKWDKFKETAIDIGAIAAGFVAGAATGAAGGGKAAIGIATLATTEALKAAKYTAKK